jgi:hypothetical protein
MPQRKALPQIETISERDELIRRRQLMMEMTDRVVSEYLGSGRTRGDLRGNMDRARQALIDGLDSVPEFDESVFTLLPPVNPVGRMGMSQELQPDRVGEFGDRFPRELLEMFMSTATENPNDFSFKSPENISPGRTIAHELSHLDFRAFPGFHDQNQSSEEFARGVGGQFQSGGESDPVSGEIASYIKYLLDAKRKKK